MPSVAQATANRANAQASTGPRTTEGKAASSRNAMKFGLTSQEIVLSHENQEDFDALHAALVNDLNPVNDTESLLIDKIAIAEWRERRVERVQKAWAQMILEKHPPGGHKALLLAWCSGVPLPDCGPRGSHRKRCAVGKDQYRGEHFSSSRVLARFPSI